MKKTLNQLLSAATSQTKAAGVLFYGSDAGLIHDSAIKVVRHWCGPLDDPFRYCALGREQQGRFGDEISAQSLMGGRRIVHMTDGSDSLVPQLKKVIAHANAAYIVIEAFGLPSRSKLRAHADASSDWASVACYPSTGQALQSEISRILAQDRIEIKGDALQFVADCVGDDHAIRQQRLETLALYVGRDAVAELSSAQKALKAYQSQTVEDAFHSAFAGNVQQADAALGELEDQEATGPSLMANLTYFLVRLLRARHLVECGASREVAMKSIAPPVFFQRLNIFSECIRLWPSNDLVVALERTRSADWACKRAGSPDVVIATHLVSEFARQSSARHTGLSHERPSNATM